MPNSGYFDQAFANSGSLTPVPDAPQGNGSVSYNQGFGILYSTPVAQGGLNIPRAQMNQLFNDITTAIQNWQQNTIAPFITTAMNGGSPYSYPQYALVLYSGVAYQSNTNSNTDTPPSSKWNVANIGSSTSFIGGTSTGTGNAQVLASLSPSGFALTDGYAIRFTAGFSNTTATTLAITSPSISATPIYKNTSAGLAVLTGGEIIAGNEVAVVYNLAGGCFVLMTYILPAATTSTLGGVIPDGTTITVSSGTISAAKQLWTPLGVGSPITARGGSGITFTANTPVAAATITPVYLTNNGTTTGSNVEWSGTGDSISGTWNPMQSIGNALTYSGGTFQRTI